MDVLPLNFRILQYCGIWYEHPEHLWLAKTLYKILVVVLLFSFTLSELAELATISSDVRELTECLFLTLTFVTCCLKMINFMCRRESLNDLLDCYRVEMFRPRTRGEELIVDRYRGVVATFYGMYVSLALLSGIGMSLLPVVSSASNGTQLPVKSYQPYDTEQYFSLFCFTYLHQLFSFLFGIVINCSMDMLTCGFLILTCGQLELCCQRISLSKGARNEHVMHHVLIGKAVNKVQSFFIVVVVLLFFCSLIVLCTSLFQMPQQNIITMEFFNSFSYLIGILYQIFLYCWFGNQLQLKSQTIADAIYDSNWDEQRPHRRKDYVFPMIMSQKGFTISFHGQCNLSIKTYVSLLKTSYGIYNLLQKTST